MITQPEKKDYDGIIVNRINNERALKRERVTHDRTDPLEIYSQSELIERFHFGTQALFELIEAFSPSLQHASDKNAASPGADCTSYCYYKNVLGSPMLL